MRNGNASIHINVDPSSLAEQYLQWGNKISLKSLPMPWLKVLVTNRNLVGSVQLQNVESHNVNGT
jgi:hypothetical protein